MRFVLVLLGLLGLGVAFLPLSPVVGRLAPGLEAEQISGSIWNGQLRGASYGGLPLGDVDVGLDPRRLLRGEASLQFKRLDPRLSGRAGGTRNERRLEALTGDVRLQLLPAPVPPAAISFDAVSLVTDVTGRCLSAGGTVSARLAEVPLLGVTPPLIGQPRCDGDALMAPLRAADGEAGLDLWLWRDGRWRAALRLSGLNPLLVAGLQAFGFQPESAGRASYAVEGRLRGA